MPKNFVGEPFSVSLISGIEIVWIRRGEYQYFSSKITCLTVPKNFVEEPFRVSLVSATEKVYEQEGRVVLRVSVENFFSHSAKNFRRGGMLYCFIIFGYGKSLEKGGGGEYQDFPSENICLTVPKFFVGKPFHVSLILGTEKVYE